jgi:multidrug efflux pump subunit AcrA (membrane-fusion protein)
MSADVTLVAREDANALVVPSPALVFREGHMQAFRVADGKAVATTVEVGIEQDGVSQIVSGLNEGDKVIVKGQFMINDGQPVDDGSGANEGRGWSGGPPAGGARPH